MCTSAELKTSVAGYSVVALNLLHVCLKQVLQTILKSDRVGSCGTVLAIGRILREYWIGNGAI